MLKYVTRRLLAVIPLLVVISFLSFGIYQLQPGDPVRGFLPLEAQDNPAEVARVRAMLGLDRPWYVQYASWFGRVVQGDLGRSVTDGEPVVRKIGRVLPNTLQLTVTSFIAGFTLAVVVGVLSATRRYSIWDHLATVFGFAGIAVPSFWLGILLMLVFAVNLRWLPATGRYSTGHEGELVDLLKHMIMPVICMAINDIAGISRYVRTALLEVLRLDYIRTARSKGLTEKIVVFRHAMRNSMMPVVTLLGLSLADFVGGALVVENLFAWPGMGRVAVNAVFQKDYPVIMAANLMFAALTVIGNLLADLMYAVVDPRVKFS